jgi:lysophospholipase L1-like esterase
MIAAWLLWHTVSVVRGRPGWLPLVACGTVLWVKRVYWPPALWALMIALAAVATLRVGSARGGGGRQAAIFRWAGGTVLWVLWAWLAGDWQWAARSSSRPRLDPARPVVCLGDSLTSGIEPYGGYPSDLAAMLTVPVVDLSAAGISAEQALPLLPRVAEACPQAVVVELGGHDFLQGRDRASTRATLVQIITAARQAGAEVILMEIPRGFIVDPYAGLERELAREFDLELISDSTIRDLVLWSPIAPPGMWCTGGRLSDDGLHPNARGNAHLARRVAAALHRLYGPEVLRSVSR